MSDDKKSDDIINVIIKMDNDEIEIVDEDHHSLYSDSGDNDNHYLVNEDDRKSPVVIKCFVEEEENEEVEDMEKEDSEDTDKDKVDEIVEHVCKKCGIVYSNWKRLMAHLQFCRTITKPEDRNARNKFIAEMQRKIRNIAVDALKMEEKGICFCCEENFETCHSGHIRCYECPKSFKTSRSFDRHIFLMHAGTEKYPCKTCNVRCPTSGILKVHENSHIRGKPYACKKCGKEFTRRYHLFRHQKFSSCDGTEPKQEVMCKVCRKTFYRVDNLRNHLRQHLDDGPKRRDYPCPHCGKRFYGTATLNIHIRSHTGEKPFKCDMCEKCFPSNAALRKHRRSHTGEKPYTCSLCPKSFAAKEVLNRHMKTHTGERPHACEICGKSFIQATQLRNHNKTHHNSEKFACTFCSKKCISRQDLQKHMKLKHESELPINTCEVCKESFGTVGGLRRHFSRIHKNPRNSSTSSTAESKGKVSKNHKKTHDPSVSPSEAFEIRVLKKRKPLLENLEETFPDGLICDLCPEKEFSSKGGLTKHINRMHKNVKYSCDVCDDVFTTSKDLDFHKLQHDEQVFKCKYCDKESNSLKLLEGHIELAHSATEIAQFESQQEDQIEEYIIQEIDIIDEQEEKVDYMFEENNAKENESKLVEFSDESNHVLMDIDDTDDFVSQMDEHTLNENVKKLLNLLIDQDILSKFGWPDAKVDKVLQEVIKNCGHNPTGFDKLMDNATKMREYVKLLFTVVIDNDSIKLLLNNHSIDEVIMQVLKMAKCNKTA